MIICAAIKIKDNIICGYRHSDCYETLYKLNSQLSKEARKQGLIIEGFLATNNRFLNRYEAYDEALHCGQLSAVNREYKTEQHESILYSEDLY